MNQVPRGCSKVLKCKTPLTVSLAFPCLQAQSSPQTDGKVLKRKRQEKKNQDRVWRRRRGGLVVSTWTFKRTKPLNSIPLHLPSLFCAGGLDSSPTPPPEVTGIKGSVSPGQPWGEGRRGEEVWVEEALHPPLALQKGPLSLLPPRSCLYQPLTEKSPQAPSPNQLSGSKIPRVLQNFHSSPSS